MQPARLNKRIIIQRPVQVQNDAGELETVYENFSTVWASIEPLQGREFFSADQVKEEITTRIRIRFLREVTAKMRVYFAVEEGSPTDYDVYDIVSVIHVREARRETQLMCTKLDAQGFKRLGSNG